MPEVQAEGPQISQTVIYNNAGTITAAIIWAVAAAGTVSIAYVNAGAWAFATGVSYSPGAGTTSTWGYNPLF
jgi:hypothetical protein